METEKWVAQAQQRALASTDASTELLQMAVPDLYAALGQQVSETTQGAREIASFSVTIDLDTLDRGVFTDLGKRVFARWSRTLHDFLCRPTKEDADLQTLVLQTLTGRDVTASALLVGVLVGTFGLAPTVATLVATLLVKLIVTPASEEICKYWDEQLANG